MGRGPLRSVEKMIESLSAENREAILSAIYARRKIDAIKLVREATGCGLAEAKEFVEKYSAELETKSPEKFAPKGNGCSVQAAMVFAAVLLVFTAYRVLKTI